MVAAPTVKQHLAAIRMLFDFLVTGHVMSINPAHAVRGPKHVVKTGKTPVLNAEQTRALLDSMDVGKIADCATAPSSALWSSALPAWAPWWA